MQFDEFSFRGRAFVDSERLKLASPAVLPPNAGVLINLRIGSGGRVSAMGWANSGGAGHYSLGRNNAASIFQLRNNALTELVMGAPGLLNLNSYYTTFAWCNSSTSNYLALNSVATLEHLTSSFAIDTVNSFRVGIADTTSNQGNFVGTIFWIALLRSFPPLDQLDLVMRQLRPPTILGRHLANLIPIQGTSPERCIITGSPMTVDLGTTIGTVNAFPLPQMPRPLLSLGQAVRRFTFYRSYGGDNEAVATLDAPTGATAVAVNLPLVTSDLLRIAVNGGAPVEVAMPGAPNALSGALVVGAGMLNGVIQTEAGDATIEAVAVSPQSGAGGLGNLWTVARAQLAPIVATAVNGVLAIAGESGSFQSVDLGPLIVDPAGEGYTLAVEWDDTSLSLVLVGTTLDYNTQVAGSYDANLTITSLHSLAPTTVVRLTFELTTPGNRYVNGYRYSYAITRGPVPGITTAGALDNFPVPIRVVAQNWAKSTLAGGSLEGLDDVVDLRAEATDGTELPIDILPGWDKITGTGYLHVRLSWDPSVGLEFNLFSGRPLEFDPSLTEDVWIDYDDVWHGDVTGRNPAQVSRPWQISEMTEVVGLVGPAGNFAQTQAEVSLPECAHWSGQSDFDILVACKRSVPTGGNHGMLGAGDLTSDATARFGIRDSTSTSLTTNTIRAHLDVSDGRTNWRGPAGLQTTAWQVIGFRWRQGEQPQVAVDGLLATNSLVPVDPVRAGTTQFLGRFYVGLAGGAATLGPWNDLLDEVRKTRGGIVRGTRWRLAEYLSLTDPVFVSIGTQHVPGDIVIRPLQLQPDIVSATYVANGSVLIDVTFNDFDPEGQPLTVISATTPAIGGTVTIESNQVRWNYPVGSLGTHSLTYTIDGTLGRLDTTGTVQVTLTGAVSVGDNLRLFGKFVGWPYGGSISTGNRQCLKTTNTSYRIRIERAGRLMGIGWNPRLQADAPTTNYSNGLGGQVQVRLVEATDSTNPRLSEPNESAVLAQTLVNGGFSGMLKDSATSMNGRVIDQAEILAVNGSWDFYTQGNQARGNTEFWKFQSPTRDLAVGEVVFAQFIQTHATDYCSLNMFYYAPNWGDYSGTDNGKGQMYDYDRQGGYYAHWPMVLIKSGSGWDEGTYSGCATRLLLRWTDGFVWALCGGGAQISGARIAFSATQRARSEWTQPAPATIICNRIIFHAGKKSATMTAVRVTVLDVTASPTTLYDGTVSADGISTFDIAENGPGTPWVTKSLGQNITFQQNRRYRLTWGPENGTCQICTNNKLEKEIGVTGPSGNRDGDLGTHDMVGGSISTGNQWPVAFVAVGVTLPFKPELA